MTTEAVAREAALYAKLADVIKEVGEVANDARNEHFKYTYTSAEAMLRALRGPLAQRNIALLSSITSIEDREYQTSQGKASVITTVHIDFTFVDGDTGAMHRCCWAGRGDDAADKGLGKAYTSAIKTFLREQFLIPQGDDPEADAGTDQRAGERAPAASGQARTPGLATPAQQRLIRARASEKNIDPVALANLLRRVANADAKTFDTPEAADLHVTACLEAMQWQYVDRALEAIGAYEPPAPEQEAIGF